MRMSNVHEPDSDDKYSVASESEEPRFQLHSAWLRSVEQGEGQAFRNSRTVMDLDVVPDGKTANRSATAASEALDRVCRVQTGDRAHQGPRWAKRILIKPNSPLRYCLDICGCTLICADVVRIPLSLAFDVPETLPTLLLAWASRVFWSLYIFASMLSTYVNTSGAIEQSVIQVAKHNARTWLVFNLLTVWAEWAELASEREPSRGGVMQIVGLLRFARLLRAMRHVSFASEVLRVLKCHIRSEGVIIVVDIVKILTIIAAVTHAIACLWYGLSTSWPLEYEDAGLGHTYAVSFHWSLTQFTGASSTVGPQSATEYGIANLVVSVTFVISAFFVSSITTSMTRLQLLNTHHSRQLNVLSRYLSGQNISVALTARIQRNAQFALAEQRRNVPEQSVELLQLLSKPVRVELDYEVHSPTLQWHPFFAFYKRCNAAAIRQTCHIAVSRVTLSSGDVLFSDGEIQDVPGMFFLLTGDLQYRRGSSSQAPVKAGQWLCEATLWVQQWATHGVASAVSDCCLLRLDADKFQSAALQFKKLEFYPALYADAFVMRLNEVDAPSMLTELRDDTMINPAELVAQIDPDAPERSHSHQKRGSLSSWGSLVRSKGLEGLGRRFSQAAATGSQSLTLAGRRPSSTQSFSSTGTRSTTLK